MTPTTTERSPAGLLRLWIAAVGAALALGAREARAQGGAEAGGPLGGAPSSGFSMDELSQMKLEELLNVPVVTATLTGEKLENAPTSIVVLTADDIARYNFRTLGEALDYVAGLDVLSDHDRTDVGVRGLFGDINANGSSIRVLVDGMDTAFRSTGANSFDHDQVPIEAVDRIEIVRGPFSVVYGAGALLGVVNVITKAGAASGASGWVRGQTWKARGNGVLGVSGEHKGERWFAGGSLGGTYEDESGLELPRASVVYGDSRFSDPRSRISRGDTGRYLTGNVHAGVTPVEPLSLRLDGLVSYTDASAQFQPYSLLRPDNRISELRSQARLTGTYTRDWFTAEARTWFNLGRTLPRARMDIGLNDYLFRRDVAYDVYGGHLRIAVEPWTWLSAWAQVEHEIDIEHLNRTEVLHDGTSAPLQDDTIGGLPWRPGQPIPTIANTALSAHAILTCLEWLRLTAGARLDHHSVYSDSLSLRSGIVAQSASLGYLKLLAGRSFKAPTPEQLYWEPVGIADFRGNPDLKPQYANTFELVVGSRKLRSVTVEATGYLNVVQDRVIYVERSGRFEAQNIADSKTLGAELEVELHQLSLADGLRLSGLLGFGWQSTTTTLDELQRSLLTEQDVLFPSWKATALVDLEIQRLSLAVVLRGRFTGDRLVSQTNVQALGGALSSLEGDREVDLGFRVLNLDRVAHVPGLELRSMIRNILGQGTATPGYNGFEIPRAPTTVEVMVAWSSY